MNMFEQLYYYLRLMGCELQLGKYIRQQTTQNAVASYRNYTH
jgi:hypothetical protein